VEEVGRARRRGRRALAGAAALGYAALLFFLSGRPARSLPGSWFPHGDKLVHALAYVLLGALVAIVLEAGRPGRSRRVILAWVLAAAYGASDEWHQSFVPGRESSLGDLAADTLGAGAGILLVARAARPGRRREEQGGMGWP
jgi:VanZ family protein